MDQTGSNLTVTRFLLVMAEKKGCEKRRHNNNKSLIKLEIFEFFYDI